MLAGGLATDLLIARLRPGPDRPGAFRAVAALAPVLLWGAWMAAYALAYGIAWPPELWAGVLGMASLSGLGLSVLVLPPPAMPSRDLGTELRGMSALIRGDVFFWQSLQAAAILVAVPIAPVSNLFLDRFISGFTMGAVKG